VSPLVNDVRHIGCHLRRHVLGLWCVVLRLDGSDDVVGIVLQTALGGSAVQLAGQLVDIAENVEQLRAAYLQHAEAGLQDLAGHAGHPSSRASQSKRSGPQNASHA